MRKISSSVELINQTVQIRTFLSDFSSGELLKGENELNVYFSEGIFHERRSQQSLPIQNETFSRIGLVCRESHNRGRNLLSLSF